MPKNNIELVQFAREMVGSVYWYRTYGQVGNSKLLSECAKRYPNQYSQKRINTAHERGDFGKRVMDCSGLIKNYLMSKHGSSMPPDYDSKYDLSANSFHTKATEKGSVKEIPEIIGLGLWKNNHVGVYIGGGKVIEARGFDYGVIESDIKDVAWVDWFKIPFIEYAEVGSNIPDAAAAEAPKADPSPVAPQEYKVVPGDTLTKLASMWGCTVKDIVAINEIDNPDVIFVGQLIKIPNGSEAASSESPIWIGTVATQRDPLRVRATKSTANNNNVVRLLPKGSQVDLIGDNEGGWYKLADGTGYVAAKFISR